MAEMIDYVLNRMIKVEHKEENAGNRYFLPFPTLFFPTLYQTAKLWP